MIKSNNLAEDIEDIEDAVEEVVEDAVEEVVEVDGGIFDEDLNGVEGAVSDFDIGTTLLSVASPVDSWAGQNLEEKLSRELVEKDWGDDEKFVGTDVYTPGEPSDVYGATTEGDVYSASTGSDLYGTSSGGDLYSGAGGGGAYNTGKGDGVSYDVQAGGSKHIKSFDEVKDNRRTGRSMLEIAGFEDKNKQKHRDEHSFVKYQEKGSI